MDADAPASDAPVDAVDHANCCVVGGGPAGVVLALLLARRGVNTVLLEAHRDFDRDFRGDTLFPSVMEIMAELGLADRLLALPHGKMRTMTFHTPRGELVVGDLGRLRTAYPYVTMLPQSQFLRTLTEEADRLPAFRRLMGATVQRLIIEGGEVRGVCYRGPDDRLHDVRADLTVGADGRFSKLRQLVGLVPVSAGSPIDLLWLRVPRCSADASEAGGGFLGPGRYMIVLSRGDQWQIGYVFPKGAYPQLRAAGLDELRRSIAELAPGLASGLESITDWRQAPVLSVEVSRLRQWWQPGILLIGDAAHVMSPVGGVGIGNAVLDAVEAANLLAGPLRAGRLSPRDLRAVQRRREWPTRVTQAMQQLAYRLYIARVLRATGPFNLPLWVRLANRVPVLRDLPIRLIALGARRVHVKD
jgi:2-polyprenyl-6-methoxyphenol hydroxylase-like FAD-dependent oxidoreductase